MKRLFKVAVCAALLIICLVNACVVAGAFEENPLPYKIHVSRTAQVVTVTDNVTGEAVRQMICTTGAASSPTITGRFKLPKAASDERKNWYAISRTCYVHYATRIKGSYLFHSVLYDRAQASSLNRKSWTVLGQRASLGCIRLTPLDAQWIAYNCAAGTTVTINDAKPNGPITKSAQIKRTLPSPNGNGVIPGYEGTLKPTPKPGPNTQPTLTLGIEGPYTKAMQGYLQTLGHYQGSVDGKFAQTTENALKAFQQVYVLMNPGTALTVDGAATPEWQDIIKAEKGNIEYAGTARKLKPGVKGVSVKVLKQRLNELRFTTAAANTVYDDRTKAAVGNAQRAFMLKVDGVADQALQEKLLDSALKSLPYAYANIKNGLSLRKSKSSRGALVAKVKNGAKLAVVRYDGDWSYVTTGSKGGYVLSRYLEYEDPAAAPMVEE